MLRRNTAAALAFVLAVALLPVDTVAGRVGVAGLSGPGSPAEIDTSGIALVGRDAIQFRAENEAQALAFDAALNFALEHRGDMGYPWIDLETNTLELSAATEQGATVAFGAKSNLAAAGLVARVTTAQASIAKLDGLADDATRLIEAGIPHADLIWMTEPDQKNNRVVITVSEPNADLMKALATRYGTELIAVRVRAGGPIATSNRDFDSPAFWGGAYITTSTGKGCTTGFAWSAGVSAMLTAAHCISTGGTVSYPNYSNAGTVASGSEENWSDSNGTQYYTGQSVYRGDIALIRYSSYSTNATIYSGAAHTGTSTAVNSKASRWSQVGDAVCVNGVTTGGWCGMVTIASGNAWYLVNGINVWARHVVQAEALGPTCPTHGDSGAPVYRTVSGGVAAVGIYSGGAPLVLECVAYFTDIWDAWYGLPGDLKTR